MWIRLRWDDALRQLTLEPDARMKKWPGGVREFAAEIVGGDAKPRNIEFKGERVEVRL
jgi:hypothetical protein